MPNPLKAKYEEIVIREFRRATEKLYEGRHLTFETECTRHETWEMYVRGGGIDHHWTFQCGSDDDAFVFYLQPITDDESPHVLVQGNLTPDLPFVAVAFTIPSDWPKED